VRRESREEYSGVAGWLWKLRSSIAILLLPAHGGSVLAVGAVYAKGASQAPEKAPRVLGICCAATG
jgi:hypothetical protein